MASNCWIVLAESYFGLYGIIFILFFLLENEFSFAMEVLSMEISFYTHRQMDTNVCSVYVDELVW